jgi:hypothetical protein
MRELEDAGALGLGGFFRAAVLDQLDADHQAAPADIAD